MNIEFNPISLILGLTLLLMSACSTDTVDIEEDPLALDKLLTETIIDASPVGRMDYYILADERRYDYLPNQDPRNTITEEKVQLGKMIFFETGFAQDALDSTCYETYSCSTCHIPSAGFLPGRKQGIADGAYGYGISGSHRSIVENYQENELDAQGIRPLSTLNVAYVTNTLWSGLFGSKGVNEGTEEYWEGPLAEVNHLGYVGLESQNIEGVRLHRMSVNDHVLDDFGYREMFDNAFSDIPEEERYSDETISFALGAYLRTLLTTKAPFQNWLKGERKALTESQKNGAILFFSKARCYLCHNGPSFSSVIFHALGTKDLYESGGLNTSANDKRNLGRGTFTGRTEDSYKFKVPQLYNLKDYATFFHGSSKQSIREVVDFKLQAKSENPNVSNSSLSPLFQPVQLTEAEQQQLIDFLKNALYDPDINRYVPDAVLSGNCFPNNDPQSQQEIGCK